MEPINSKPKITLDYSKQPINGVIYQYWGESAGFHYALMGPDNSIATEFLRCKDVGMGIMLAAMNGKVLNGNGAKFSYDPTKNPIDIENPKILVYDSTPGMDFLCYGGRADAMLDIVNQIGDELGIPHKTQAFPCNSKDGRDTVALFCGHSDWMISPPMLSLFLSVLRIGMVHKIGDNWRDTMEKVSGGRVKPHRHLDIGYCKKLPEGIDRIKAFGFRNVFHQNKMDNWKIFLDSMINQGGHTGIYNLIAGRAQFITGYFPHWDRKNIWFPVPKSVIEKRECVMV